MLHNNMVIKITNLAELNFNPPLSVINLYQPEDLFDKDSHHLVFPHAEMLEMVLDLVNILIDNTNSINI